MTIVSLTSVPPRFGLLHETIATLLGQRGGVREVWLHIPRRYRRFPDWGGGLPDLDPRVRIVRCDDDFGPATKILPAVSELRASSDPILFCDDDRLYDPGWAGALLRAQADRPGMCVAAIGQHASSVVADAVDPTILNRARIGPRRSLRYTLRRGWQAMRERKLRPHALKPAKPGVRKAGQTEILLGYGGVVVRPDFFDDLVFDVAPPFMFVDDIWLSGHLARRGVPIWLPEDVNVARPATNDPVDALRGQVFDKMARDALNARAVRHFQQAYGIWCGRHENRPSPPDSDPVSRRA